MEDAFDQLAGDYDSSFTNTELGRILRRRTHAEIGRVAAAGDDVLEINCGTGEDAVYLARRGIRVTATDASERMIACAREKIARLELGDRVALSRCSMERLDSLHPEQRTFDGIISNFGGFNCVEDTAKLAGTLARRVRKGGYFFLCIMGRWVPWEWLYLGCRGKFRRVRDRMAGKAFWRGREIRYFTPGEVIRDFKPYCKVVRVSGLGLLLPPTYAGAALSRHPGLAARLDTIEQSIASVPGVAQLSDHFMLTLRRS